MFESAKSGCRLPLLMVFVVCTTVLPCYVRVMRSDRKRLIQRCLLRPQIDSCFLRATRSAVGAGKEERAFPLSPSDALVLMAFMYCLVGCGLFDKMY